MARTRANSSDTDLEALDSAQEQAFKERVEEATGGLPSRDTQRRLMEDEIQRPLEEDFFDFCEMSYVRQGIPIIYYIKKDGKHLTTLKPPLTWDRLRDQFGAGHYQVSCKDERSMTYLKQKTEILAELPEVPVNDEPQTPFAIGGTAPNNDLASVLALMQRQDERREIAERNARERDEARRREDKEREEDRRRQDRESRNDFLKMLLPLAAPLLEKIMAPKPTGVDPTMQLVIEQLKENNRNLEARLTAMTQGSSALDTKTLLEMENKARDRERAARKEGREEMEKIYEIAEERAETRAAEMVEKGDSSDSTVTETLIKSLAPALGTLLTQGRGIAGPAPAPAIEDQSLDDLSSRQEYVEETVDATQAVATGTVTPIRGARPSRQGGRRGVNVKRPRGEGVTQDDLDRKKVIDLLFPFIIETFQRMQNGNPQNPQAAARESLEMLALKGFGQDRVLQLFTKHHLKVLVLDKLPEEHHSWFNSFYAALGTRPSDRVPAGTRSPDGGVDVPASVVEPIESVRDDQPGSVSNP